MENSIARYLRLAEKKGSDSGQTTVFSTVVGMIFCWIFTVSQLKKLVSENWKIFNFRFYLLLLLIGIAAKFTYRELLAKKSQNDNKTYKNSHNVRQVNTSYELTSCTNLGFHLLGVGTKGSEAIAGFENWTRDLGKKFFQTLHYCWLWTVDYPLLSSLLLRR